MRDLQAHSQTKRVHLRQVGISQVPKQEGPSKMMGKGRRMGLRLPMLSRTSSQTVMELSIYSASSSSDEEDTLGSDWSEWEDPTWVKDDNLR